MKNTKNALGICIVILLNGCNAEYSAAFQAKTKSNDTANKCLDLFVNNKLINYSYSDNTQFLCREGYAVLYSNKKYVPIYAVEKITEESE